MASDSDPTQVANCRTIVPRPATSQVATDRADRREAAVFASVVEAIRSKRACALSKAYQIAGSSPGVATALSAGFASDAASAPRIDSFLSANGARGDEASSHIIAVDHIEPE